MLVRTWGEFEVLEADSEEPDLARNSDRQRTKDYANHETGQMGHSKIKINMSVGKMR